MFVEWLKLNLNQDRLDDLTLKHSQIKPIKTFEIENIISGLKVLHERVKNGEEWDSKLVDFRHTP